MGAEVQNLTHAKGDPGDQGDNETFQDLKGKFIDIHKTQILNPFKILKTSFYRKLLHYITGSKGQLGPAGRPGTLIISPGM